MDQACDYWRQNKSWIGVLPNALKHTSHLLFRVNLRQLIIVTWNRKAVTVDIAGKCKLSAQTMAMRQGAM